MLLNKKRNFLCFQILLLIIHLILGYFYDANMMGIVAIIMGIIANLIPEKNRWIRSGVILLTISSVFLLLS